MSRTRLLRPDFFKDERMAALSITARYVYMGLWTLCDDAGYFELKPRQIAAELFPYEGPARRQRVVDGCLADLVANGRIRYLECGEHAVVPTLPKHGTKGGNKAETYLARHRGTCLVHTQADRVRTGPSKSSSDSVSDSGSDSVRVEERADAQALEHAAAEAGGFVAGLAARRNGAKADTAATPRPEPSTPATPDEPDWMTK
jgi:hypothetical protein